MRGPGRLNKSEATRLRGLGALDAIAFDRLAGPTFTGALAFVLAFVFTLVLLAVFAWERCVDLDPELVLDGVFVRAFDGALTFALTFDWAFDWAFGGTFDFGEALVVAFLTLDAAADFGRATFAFPDRALLLVADLVAFLVEIFEVTVFMVRIY